MPAPLFAALGDEVRLQIIARLCAGGPMSITRLTTGFAVTRQAITKHLKVMEQAGLARKARRGRETIWELDQAQVEAARRYLDEISNQWDEALDRLKAYVEN